MSFGIFIINLVIFGIAASASVNSTDHQLNETKRSGRTYDDPYSRIPLYYKSSQDESADSTESEEDTTPRREVPTSFADFNPSNKRTETKDTSYYGSKGKIPFPVKNWKGDWGSGDNTPTWMTPSPADMAMMINLMKEMNGVPSVADEPTGLLSKLISDPVALLLPAAIILGVLIPVIIPLFTAGNTGSNGSPTITTTASGDNKARKLGDNPLFVKPILEAIESFSSRSLSGDTCLQKSFCEATRGSNHTDFRPMQRSIYKAFTFVDDYWLETLGVKQLMEAMGTGNCDKINCGETSTKENGFKHKHA